MKTMKLLVTMSATLLLIGSSTADAGKTVEEGALVCVNDKWSESELAKGHKLFDYAGRCVAVPDDAALPKSSEECVGTYEYLPDGSWKASGTCTLSYPNEQERISKRWEEGSHLKESTYSYAGGTGRFEGITGGGTYALDALTDTLYGGRYRGIIEQP